MSNNSSINFVSFYEAWFEHLHQLIRQLSTTPGVKQNTMTEYDDDQEKQETLEVLVHAVMSHLTEYYRVKSAATERDPLFVFTACWATCLERSLHWIAGWRPTTAFHLIYSESSILFESRIVDILHGLRSGDLADLSPSQFRRVSDLQCQTVEEENAITEELSEWQDKACEVARMMTDLNQRMERLSFIIKKADDLRLRTIQRVVEFLTPKQAAEFLIAAAELQFGVRGWGLIQDRHRGNV